MKKFLFILSFMAGITTSSGLFGQDTVSNPATVPVYNDTLNGRDDTAGNTGKVLIFEKLDVVPHFPGGQEGWKNFLKQNLDPDIPLKNGAPLGKYTVLVQFIVDKDGSLSNIEPLTNHGYGMEEEVLRMIRLSPKWEPAQQNNQSVKAYQKQPVTFVVSKDRKMMKEKKQATKYKRKQQRSTKPTGR